MLTFALDDDTPVQVLHLYKNVLGGGLEMHALTNTQRDLLGAYVHAFRPDATVPIGPVPDAFPRDCNLEQVTICLHPHATQYHVTFTITLHYPTKHSHFCVVTYRAPAIPPNT